MKYYAIGDIHGNLKALEQCLERSPFDPEKDTLIGLGDYADGHPESSKVVQKLIGLPNFIGILGNHDEWAREWLINGDRNFAWLSQGGQATYDSYLENPHHLKSDEHKKFFKNLHLYYILELKGKKYGFVHGGWSSDKGLGHESNNYIYYWDRKIWEWSTSRNYNLTKAVEKKMGDLDYVFIGHTSTDYLYPDASVPVTGCDGKIINLDQGAGWSGKLTICDIETFDCWQSDDAISLYGKKGR